MSSVFRASVRSDNTLRLDPFFALGFAGEIEVRPNRPDLLYIAEGPRIHVYDFSEDTVITPAGITYVNGFTFGPDGTMYVTATTPTGEELLRLDPDTGNVIQTLASFSGQTISSGGHGLASQFGTVAYQVPEPTNVCSVVMLVGLLARRR